MKEKTEVPSMSEEEFDRWEARFLAWAEDETLVSPDFASIQRRRQARLRYRHWLFALAAMLLIGCGVMLLQPVFHLEATVSEREIAHQSGLNITVDAATGSTIMELSWDTEVEQLATLQPAWQSLQQDFAWQLAAFDPITDSNGIK